METHRKIIRAVLAVGVFVLLGRVFGAVREILLAARFGTGDVIDAYVLMSSITSWPVAVWMSTLTAIAVPLLVRAGTDGVKETGRFVGELSTASIMGGLGLMALLIAVLWHFAGFELLGLPPATVAALGEMLVPLSLTVPLGLLISVLSVRLIAQKRHINTLLDGVPALVVSVALVFFVPMTAAQLAWATVGGFALQAIVLSRLLGRNGPVLARPTTFDTPQWRSLSNGLTFFTVGQLAVGAIAFIDPIMIAGQGAGSVAAFGYANRILALALGLTATAVARGVLPAFAQLSSDSERLARTAKSWIVWLLAAGVTSAAVGWVAAPWVVKLVFERGQFTAADTEAVTSILRFGLLQLPFYLSGIVAVQLLAAQGRHREITKSGLINVGVKLVANVLLIGAFGGGGAMLATALMYVVALMYLWRVAFAQRRAKSNVQSG